MALRLGVHPLSGLTLSIGAFALSWAIGFVIVLAPAGTGFRDAMLIAVLSTQMSVGAATAITLVSRIATALADGIAAGVSVIFYKYKHRASRDLKQRESREAATGTGPGAART
jgi:uncharacterized membrane protein YbhN (UPF0104 family)